MAKVLALRLSGPLQAWGTETDRNERRTDTMPSKSGVLGMIAAAMGRKRNEDVSDLRSLRFGARADYPGSILRDYQTAHIWNYDEKGRPYASGKGTYTGRRHYIQDACFTACLEGDEALLERCRDALEQPVYPLYLGRRSCVPDGKVFIGLYDGDLESVLTTLPRQPRDPLADAGDPGTEKELLRICVESYDEWDRMRCDNPLSFDFHDRQHSNRAEKEFFAEIAG